MDELDGWLVHLLNVALTIGTVFILYVFFVNLGCLVEIFYYVVTGIV